MEMAAKAPKTRNTDVMRMWFDAWNADNERAREEYELLLDEQESADRQSFDPPTICRRRLHPIRVMDDVIRSPKGQWWCVRCREDGRRPARRNKRYIAKRLTPAVDAQIRRRYEAGESSTQIAPDYRISEHTVRKAVRRAGGEIRSFQEAAVLHRRRSG